MNEAAPRARVVLVTGLSGAGKASILRTLEDLGYEAIDNPPLQMIEQLVTRMDAPAGTSERRIAVGVDARSRGFDAEAVLATVRRLRQNPSLRLELVFAWAEETVLLRRFTETRRRHPLSARGVNEGIAAEQALTGLLHESADLLIDTSDLPLPALRQRIERRFGGAAEPGAVPDVAVSLISFAFPAGLPRQSDMVFDVRFLSNPHYVAELKPKTGLDPDVGRFIESDAGYRPFFAQVVGLLTLLLPRFVQEGKKYLSIAIGCTGGRHRSVYVAEALARELTQAGWRVTTMHRELTREGFAPRGMFGADRRRQEPPSAQAQEA
jgi:UPF0042 nucleotide-binding protein